MNKPTIPGYIAVGMALGAALAWFLGVFSITYFLLLIIKDSIFEKLDTLKFFSPLEYLYAAMLYTEFLFLLIIILTLLFSTPYAIKEIITLPFQQNKQPPGWRDRVPKSGNFPYE